MDDDKLVAQLAAAGFRIERREHQGRRVWTWTDPRRPDDPQPIYLTRGHAASYLADRLAREGVFAPTR